MKLMPSQHPILLRYSCQQLLSTNLSVGESFLREYACHCLNHSVVGLGIFSEKMFVLKACLHKINPQYSFAGSGFH